MSDRMMSCRRLWFCAIGIAIVLTAISSTAAQDEAPVISDLEVGPPVTPFVFDGDVRDLPAPPQWQPGDTVKEIPRRL